MLRPRVFPKGALSLAILGLGLATTQAWAGVIGTFLTPPVVINNPFGIEGPDRILGTADDLLPGEFGLESGYLGATYHSDTDGDGQPDDHDGDGQPDVFTVDVWLTAIVHDLGGGLLSIDYWIFNKGTGTMVGYGDDLPNGPNWVPPIDGANPLPGSTGLDHIPNTADDPVGIPSRHTKVEGFGPIINGKWGGSFNPSTGLLADAIGVIPAPGTLALLGVAGLMGTRRRRR